ncbi:hypothetical protein ACFQU2_32170 [Siccirubricoccus deserti]
MAWTLDARIPLILVEDPAALAAALAAGPPAAVLGVLPSGQARAVVAEGFDPSTPHAPACACCQGRPSAAVALDRLFQARVRGQCPGSSGWWPWPTPLPAAPLWRRRSTRMR